MIDTLITAPAADALDWDDDIKSHLRVDSDDEETRVTDLLVPTVTDWCESATGRRLITQTRSYLYRSFADACSSARKLCKYPDGTILVGTPLVSVTWVKYYDTSNVQQTLSASAYTVTASTAADPKCGPGWIRLVPGQSFPATYDRPDAIDIKAVVGYGAASTNVPGGLKHAMLLYLGDLFENREDTITGTIVAQVPHTSLVLANSYLVSP